MQRNVAKIWIENARTITILRIFIFFKVLHPRVSRLPAYTPTLQEIVIIQNYRKMTSYKEILESILEKVLHFLSSRRRKIFSSNESKNP